MSEGQYAQLIGWICVAGLVAADPNLVGKLLLAVVGGIYFIRSLIHD